MIMEAQLTGRPYTIGLDLGGTNAVFGIVDGMGNIVEHTSIKTQEYDTAEAFVDAAVKALMPIIGYFLGTGFADKIERYDHWVAFVLLLILGGKMFIESFKKEDVERDAAGNDRDELKFTKMLVLAIATSIDALAVGITLAFLKVNIWAAASFIGMTTFIISAAGVKIGHVFGEKYTNKAELAGGLILMGIGVKILLEHLGVINF